MQDFQTPFWTGKQGWFPGNKQHTKKKKQKMQVCCRLNVKDKERVRSKKVNMNPNVEE